MDPIANMLTMVRNASMAGKETVVVPFSKVKHAILETLAKHGFVKSVAKKTKGPFPFLEIGLEYNEKRPRINEIKMISKPSRRMYLGFKEIYPIKGGRGALVLSTPKGILTGAEARKDRIGGEVLFQIW
jgi:small subunit ribosomal protein S8